MAWFRRRTPWNEVDFWALDLESTGVDVDASEILSVGMVPIRAGRIGWGERFAASVRPEAREVGDPKTVVVHQLLPSELDDADPLAEVLAEIFSRLAGNVLVVHHASLDVGLLRSAAGRVGEAFPNTKIVDTVRLLQGFNRRGVWLGREHSPAPLALDAARAYFGLPPHDHHDALADALATAELMLCLRAKLEMSDLRELV